MPASTLDEELFEALAEENPAADRVKALLDAGADPNATTGSARISALHAAVFTQPDTQPEIVRLLLDAGADPGAKDDRGETPLLWAVKSRNAPVVAELARAGADPNAKGKRGGTPLHEAAEWVNEDGVKLLLDKGADIYAKDSDGRTPEDRAITPEIKAALLAAREAKELTEASNPEKPAARRHRL